MEYLGIALVLAAGAGLLLSLLASGFAGSAYAYLTMTIELEEEEDGEEYSLSNVEIEETENPATEIKTLCNYVSGCTFEFSEGGDNEFRYNTFNPSQRVLEGTLEMTYDTKEGGTKTHYFEVEGRLDISSKSTTEEGEQENYIGDIQFVPSDILDQLVAGGEKIALGNANFTNSRGILEIKAF
jgi:hypothetical protein